MTDLPPTDHNNPPAKFALRDELATLKVEMINWLDGQRVENVEQMADVDALIATTKDLDKRFKAEKEAEYRPHKTAGDAVVADYKPDLDSLSGWIKGLLAITGAFKIEQARIKQAEANAARDKAQEAARLAQIEDQQADYGNLAEREVADQAAFDSREAERHAQAVAKEKPGGLRTTKGVEVDDYKRLINHIAIHDRPAVMAFCDDWARSKYRTQKIVAPGAKLVSKTAAF